jgi:hypothetical protein
MARLHRKDIMKLTYRILALALILVALAVGFALGQQPSIWQTGVLTHAAPLSQIPNDWYALKGAKFDVALTSTYQDKPVVILINSYSGHVWVYEFADVVRCLGNAPFPGAVCNNGGWVPGR